MKTNYDIVNISWHDVEKLTKEILKQISENKLKIDTLVPVLRGGAPLAMLLAANMDNVNTSCIHIKRSKENCPNSEFGKPILKGITNSEDIKGKNILLLEDIVDTGLTLEWAISEIKKYDPKNIYIATLYNFNKEINSNYIISGKNMDEYCWIVFPWERRLNEK